MRLAATATITSRFFMQSPLLLSMIGGPCFASVTGVLRLDYDQAESRSRYPTPRTVSMAGAGTRAAANFARNRARWTSTVRGSTKPSRPHTRSSSSPRPNTRPGRVDEGREELELLRGEVHRLALHADLEPVPVDLEIAGLEMDFRSMRVSVRPRRTTARTRATSSRGEKGLVT